MSRIFNDYSLFINTHTLFNSKKKSIAIDSLYMFFLVLIHENENRIQTNDDDDDLSSH